MSMNDYTKKVEEYLTKKETSSKALDSARGLLSPKTVREATTKQQRDIIETVGEFVFALRKKRKELKAKRNKNGS
jgi:hypothetical protein